MTNPFNIPDPEPLKKRRDEIMAEKAREDEIAFETAKQKFIEDWNKFAPTLNTLPLENVVCFEYEMGDFRLVNSNPVDDLVTLLRKSGYNVTKDTMMSGKKCLYIRLW